MIILQHNSHKGALYLAETYAAVYAAYEHYNPIVLLIKLANLCLRIAY